jgi:PAS domain S-box-containing protein
VNCPTISGRPDTRPLMPVKKKPPQTGVAASINLDDLPEAVLLTDDKHEILAANQAALDFLGYSAAELVGWPLEKVFPQLPKGLNRALTGEDGFGEFEVKVKTRDGQRAIMDFLVAPVKRDGKTAAVIHLGRNARIRRLLEMEVRRARNYFGSIVENSPYGICVTDPARHIMITNKAVEDLTGYGRDELIGQLVTLFYPSEAPATDLDLEALRGGRRVVEQLRFRKKNGEEVPVKVSRSLAYSLDDQSEIIIESYSDQTDRMRIDQLKNEFVFVAAHELRNPTTAIKMLLDIIFDDKRVVIDPIMRGYLAKVQEADDRLIHLVDDLLEVSRTEAGRLKINVEPQNIVEHVNNLIAELRPNAVSKGVNILYSPSPRTPLIKADATKLKEVLTNLMANAIKYNVTGGTVTVEHELREGALITHVSDTGIGISDADREKLFQKFWRSDDLAVRAQAGTGLGLFIVKELVERMGGKVWAKSRPGKGSTFSFTLPIAE